MACKMRRARGGHGAFPPAARLDVMSMATRKPAQYHCAATRWSLADLVAALTQGRIWTMSRSSIWRILDEADLKLTFRTLFRPSEAIFEEPPVEGGAGAT